MPDHVSDAVLDLFCDERWLGDRPQAHSILLMARELRKRRRQERRAYESMPDLTSIRWNTPTPPAPRRMTDDT